MARGGDEFYSWNSFWTAWRFQPVHVQRDWMMADPNVNNKLFDALRDVIKYAHPDVKDEIFEYAPDDVKKYFGYTKKEERKQSPKVRKPSYNANYKTELMKKLGL